ncbi:Bug family tripartite tricarboxylate transporter substrate binding protein [Rhodoplanes sp. SY1]|uniref:Bug family tripartite tricarboxylate transporter substrate binding protein n=1 Tax=Rhodoplanes sp. SY1 TaxID=3166646 RepID=UPI0038B5AC08
MRKSVLSLAAAVCLAVTGGVAGSLVVATTAAAQDKFPSKPVKIIVPYAPGGATDIVARLIGEHMRQDLGQSFVVENKPGAFGIIAIEEMARAKPDGYTLMVGNVSTNAITPVLFPKKFKIDYVKDVVPVTRLVDIPEFMVATTKDFPPKNVKELVDHAKKNPGKVRYGSVGVGSYPHYDAALFAKRAGDLDMVAIHNKAGASGVINDLVSGDAQFAFLNVASTAPMIKAGNLRPFALVNHARLPDYPDVPTMDELGYKGVGTIAWQGLFAPAGTPPEVLETLYKAAVKAMQAPAVQEAFKKQNFNVVPSPSVAEAKTWLAGEMKTWKTIADEVKIELAE